jgi:CRP-like cAMP-binding protein
LSAQIVNRMPHPKPDIPQILARLPLFQELSREQVAALAAATRERRLQRGEILFHKGDPSRGFYIVVTGQIKLAFPSIAGNEKVVQILGARQSFGEAVMFMERPMPVFAEALVDSSLLQVGAQAVFEMLESDASFSRRMLAGLAQRLHALVQDVEFLSQRSSAQRVIGYLLQQCPSDIENTSGPRDVELPTSKQVIASRLNLTPETLSRVFHELTLQGLIAVSGKHITIHDIPRLRDYDL